MPAWCIIWHLCLKKYIYWITLFSFQSNIDEDPKMSVSKDNNCKIVESVHRSILDELIDDAILDVCFEVHRNAKLSHLLVENPEKYVLFS